MVKQRHLICGAAGRAATIFTTTSNPDLCGVEVARDVGVGDVLAVDQLAQQEAIGVREVPCLKHLHGPHGNGLVGYI